jgi:hypothetical protein
MTIAIVATVALTLGAVVGYALGWWLARSTKKHAPLPGWAGYPIVTSPYVPADKMYVLGQTIHMHPRQFAKFTDITES